MKMFVALLAVVALAAANPLPLVQIIVNVDAPNSIDMGPGLVVERPMPDAVEMPQYPESEVPGPEPEVPVPEPVELPEPVLPIVIPDPIVLPEPTLPVVVPPAQVIPEPVLPAPVLPESVVPEGFQPVIPAKN